MKKPWFLVTGIFMIASCHTPSTMHKIPADSLFDKIKGALVGQLLGNLNGLPYEEKYNDEPGTLSGYVPALVPGAYTDDDTDIEWTYIIYMEKEDTLFLPDSSITHLWLKHFDRDIYSSNYYARELMKTGLSPRLTGNIFVNPWSRVNVAGQFNCETFAFVAPGMCRTAEEIAMHYTSVVVSEEPLQSTQLFAAMIAKAFVTGNRDSILQAGIAALDKNSHTFEAVTDAIRWVRQYPNDWKATRREVRKKYYFCDSFNKSLANTCAIIAEYLYGEGDFVKTMEIAFNWGFDADCNAATLGSILGAIKGYSWFEKNGWQINDVYCNKNRKGLPEDETITRFAERIMKLADKAILQYGGKKEILKEKLYYTIALQEPATLCKVTPPDILFETFEKTYKQKILAYFASGNPDTALLAANTYLAYVLKIAEDIRDRNPEQWQKGINSLKRQNELLWCVKNSPDNYVKKMLLTHGIQFVFPEPSLKGNVEFKLAGYPAASQVFVTGTLNGWKAWKTPMAKTAGGWMCRINLNPGRYEYKIVVDNVAMLDPANPLQEQNVCDGTTNSILIVK